jgi:hypothetical protein
LGKRSNKGLYCGNLLLGVSVPGMCVESAAGRLPECAAVGLYMAIMAEAHPVGYLQFKLWMVTQRLYVMAFQVISGAAIGALMTRRHLYGL